MPAAASPSTPAAALGEAAAPEPTAGAGASAPLCALAAVQLCFGLFPVFGRLAMDPEAGFSPFAVATWRIGVGAVCLFLLAFSIYGRRAIRAARTSRPSPASPFSGSCSTRGSSSSGSSARRR